MLNLKNMIENNHKNDLPCAFAETLVAVLYGEATPTERREFNKHYNDCSFCREELISFGSIRDVVAEWRAADFDSVQTPAIALPEVKNQFISQNTKISWSERIRSFLFLPGGGRFQSATAFAALSLCALLLAVFSYAVINRFAGGGVRIADVSNSSVSKPVLNNPTPTPFEIIGPAQVDPKPKKKSADSTVDSNKKPTQSAIKPIVHQNKPIIAQLTAHPSNKPSKSPDVKVQTAPKTPELAIESVDDLEDHSLRLSDLLDEVTPSI